MPLSDILSLAIAAGSILGTLGGLPQVARLLRRQPFLGIENIHLISNPMLPLDLIGTFPVGPVPIPSYKVQFEIWNTKAWWRFIRGSHATKVQYTVQVYNQKNEKIDEENQTGPMQKTIDLLPPKKRAAVSMPFNRALTDPKYGVYILVKSAEEKAATANKWITVEKPTPE